MSFNLSLQTKENIMATPRANDNSNAHFLLIFVYRLITLKRSAMTIGSAYACDRKFFTEIGEMDDGQILWGGDNIELSLRVSC